MSSTVPDRAWAEIDLSALRHNIKELRRISDGRELMAVVKANGYGHGAVPAAQAALEAGASFLAVADVWEGVELRDAGLEAPILVLGPSLPDEVEVGLEHSLQLSVSPAENLAIIRAAASRRNVKAKVHLKVDTGMSRNGMPPEEALEAACAIAQDEHLELVGLATHFIASEDEELVLAKSQLEKFQEWLSAFEEKCPRPPYVHTANSAAVAGFPASHFNLIRPGLSIYGLYPSEHLRTAASLEPVMSVRARITLLRDLPAGATVGYGATYTAARATRLASVPVGYEDGWPTSLSGRVEVLVHGRRVPVVGRVSMDCMMVDVGSLEDVSVGEVVTLLGRDGDEVISAEELAERSGRIPYEVVCGIGRRIRHRYVETPCAPS